MLSAKAEACNEALVTTNVLSGEIPEKASSLAYQLEETAPGLVVLVVTAQMPTDLVDPLSDKGYLNFRGASVLVVGPILSNYGLLAVGVQHTALLASLSIFFVTHYTIRKR